MKKNALYIMGAIIIVSFLVILIIQIQNKKIQGEVIRELERMQEEKEFCDSLEISIGEGAVPYGYPAGVNYAFCSNKDTTAKSIVILKNGLTDEEDENLKEGSCMVQQIQYWAGYTGSGYQGGVSCDDLASIELISDRCPQVKDIVTDMTKITCGI